MLQIKLRLFSIDDLLTSLPATPDRIKEECCYLQLRLCCESLALGCLAIHGDIPATKKKSLRSAYEASKIISQLDELYKGFFPVPTKMEELAQGGLQLNPLDEETSKKCLTKDDVVRLWRRSGSKLHKGNIKNLTSGKIEELNFKKVISWRDKFRTLLNQHYISNYDRGVHYVYQCTILNRKTPIAEAITFAAIPEKPRELETDQSE